ncbi:MAG: hypothetical protein Ct9H300mP25_12670 [Acidobacteriota bacterium]|nr:MAG: hypothetical protein Ct9H300mP25_12670 [Acidobacteriota bacterium]
MTGGFYTPEMMGPGVGLFDYDNDGTSMYIFHRVIYLATVNHSSTTRRTPPHRPIVSERPRGAFRWNTDTAVYRCDRRKWMRSQGYGIGVATGDYDNDGWVDLYVTRFGPNQMFRNLGDGTFMDVQPCPIPTIVVGSPRDLF